MEKYQKGETIMKINVDMKLFREVIIDLLKWLNNNQIKVEIFAENK